MIPQAWKDLWKDPRAHAVALGVLAYCAPIALQGFLQAGHMSQIQWDAFVVEAKAAWQHATAAFAIIVPVLMTIVKAARELYLAPPGTVIVPIDPAAPARPEGD